MSTSSSRRTKFHPPPPSPKILHFPRTHRRTRHRKHPSSIHHTNNPLVLLHKKCLSYKGKLENLFDQDNDYNEESPISNVLLNSNSALERRERVEEVEDEEGFGECNAGGKGFEEEKWRFQAEILRAECNFLRMERQFALKKLERNRVKMERTLRSAVHTLVSGREKIYEGKNADTVLDEEIEDLAEKLEELQNTSRAKDYEVKKCSNFDKKASVLQRRLEKLGGLSSESSSNNRDIDNVGSVSSRKTEHTSTEVDMLGRKMEGLSKGMLERVEEECGSMISSSVASSASTSKRVECPDFSSRQFYQEPVSNENKCSGRCKGVIRRIVEQVRAETEQWSQMQQMLVQVRGEMEELQASRDFWENRAHSSDYEIQSLKHDVEEWKEKALEYEIKANQLQLELSVFKGDVQRSKKADSKHGENRKHKQIPDMPPVPLRKQLEKEKLVADCQLKEKEWKFESSIKEINEIEEENKDDIRTPTKDVHRPISLAKQLAKEKKMFFHHRSKENIEKSNKQELLPADGGRRKTHSKHSPLRDIGNSLSPLMSRQTSRASSRFHSPENPMTIGETIRQREPKASFLY